MGRLPGAAQYIDRATLTTCNRCNASDLAWATSKRTGKRYLCKTARSQSERAWGTPIAQPWMPHRCDEHRAELASRTVPAAPVASRYAGVRMSLAIARQARLAGMSSAKVALILNMVGDQRRHVSQIGA